MTLDIIVAATLSVAVLTVLGHHAQAEQIWASTTAPHVRALFGLDRSVDRHAGKKPPKHANCNRHHDKGDHDA